MANKIEISEKEKNKIMQYSNAVRAGQAVMDAYVQCTADARDVPKDYVFDGKELCWIPKPEKVKEPNIMPLKKEN